MWIHKSIEKGAINKQNNIIYILVRQKKSRAWKRCVHMNDTPFNSAQTEFNNAAPVRQQYAQVEKRVKTLL